MKAIGHYDFGQNLRPIDFDGWYDRRQSQDAKSLAFWLEYWLASYEYLLKNPTEGINFFNYDELCQNPQSGLKKLAQITQSNNPEALVAFGDRIRQPRAREIDSSNVSTSILSEVNLLYAKLKEIWRC